MLADDPVPVQLSMVDVATGKAGPSPNPDPNPSPNQNPNPNPDPNQASVKAWTSVPKDDPVPRIALCRGGEVIVEISSRRYDDIPMVLQGPGAGLKITAAGVFADLLRLSRSLVSFNVPVKVD